MSLLDRFLVWWRLTPPPHGSALLQESSAGIPLPAAAFSFLESGGHVTLTEWAGLEVVERAALTAAARRLSVIHAQRAGLCDTPRGRLEAQSVIDDGLALETSLLEEGVISAAS